MQLFVRLEQTDLSFDRIWARNIAAGERFRQNVEARGKPVRGTGGTGRVQSLAFAHGLHSPTAIPIQTAGDLRPMGGRQNADDFATPVTRFAAGTDPISSARSCWRSTG